MKDKKRIEILLIVIKRIYDKNPEIQEQFLYKKFLYFFHQKKSC